MFGVFVVQKEMIMRRIFTLILIFTITIVNAFSISDEEQVILNAMRDELSRSAQELKFEEFTSPYYMHYTYVDTDYFYIRGYYGVIKDDIQKSNKDIAVQIRYGNMQFDQKQALDTSCPEEINYDAVRTMYWMITDSCYKNVLTSYLSKKSEIINKVPEKDRPPSFSTGEVNKYYQDELDFKIDIHYVKDIVKKLSALFKNYDWLTNSFIYINGEYNTYVLITSEGAEIVKRSCVFSIIGMAYTVCPEDGMEISNFFVERYANFGEISDYENLKIKLEDMVNELKILRDSEQIQPYSGPAILDPIATNVYFHEAVGHRVEGHRISDKSEGQTFKDKVGTKIVSDIISIYDDPTIEKFNGESIISHYLYDEEGTKSSRVELIKGGILTNFLMSRIPNKHFNNTNGHGRSNFIYAPVARMGTFITKSSREVSYDKLKQMLIAECKRQNKPYGIIIKGVYGGFTITRTWHAQSFYEQPKMVYKVDLETGEETPVRGAILVGTPLNAINKIIATCDDYKLSNSYCGAESGYIPQSGIAPSCLTKEIELQNAYKHRTKMPILAPPYSRESDL
jgi:predicted Zn-dependent protease